MNDSFKTVLAFIGGAAAGLIAGILIAPDKGSETRKRLLSGARDLTSDLTDAAKTKYNDLLNWKESMIDGASEKVKNAYEQPVDHA